MDLASKTLAELNLKSIRPLGRMLFVRTEPFENKTPSGLLYLPGKLHGFFGGLPHMRNVFGTVVAAGPKCSVKVMERIMFIRLHFAHWKPMMEEGAFLGWIDESQVIGYPLMDSEDVPQIKPVPATRSRALAKAR